MRRPSPLLELTKARIKEFYREPGAVFWVFVFPVLLAVGLGIAFRNRPPEKPRVVVLQHSNSEWIFAALQEQSELRVSQMSQGDANHALKTGRIDLLVKADKAGSSVIYQYDPSRDGAELAQLKTSHLLQQRLGRKDVVDSQLLTTTEPGGRYIDFLLPGLIGLNLMGSSLWGIGYAVVWDRRRKLLKRYASTPMRRSHYLLSYMLSRLVFMLAEVVALVTFGYLVFDVTVQGSLLGLGLVALCGATTFAGMSLLVASRVESIEAASGWMNFVQLPMWLLSGSFFAYSRFPESLHPAIKLLPLTALNDALRAITNDGATAVSTWPQLVVLLVWGLLAFGVALRIFRWQ